MDIKYGSYFRCEKCRTINHINYSGEPYALSELSSKACDDCLRIKMNFDYRREGIMPSPLPLTPIEIAIENAYDKNR